jgi:hypothetical protein
MGATRGVGETLMISIGAIGCAAAAETSGATSAATGASEAGAPQKRQNSDPTAIALAQRPQGRVDSATGGAGVAIGMMTGWAT